MSRDKKTLELIEQIKTQQQEIEKAERPIWKTNCSFSYYEDPSKSTNIRVESNLRNLIMMIAFLRERERGYVEAAKSLGFDTVFTWCGFTVADWIDDIKTRIYKVQIDSKKKKLEVLEHRLAAILSPELKADLELRAIEKELM